MGGCYCPHFKDKGIQTQKGTVEWLGQRTMSRCFVRDRQSGVAVEETEEKLREAKFTALTGPRDRSSELPSGTTWERWQSGREAEDRSGKQA